MPKQLFREKSLNYVSSPEQLNDYLKVTKPSVWAILAAVIVLLVGLFIWSRFAYITSYVEGTADVKNGMMVVTFNDVNLASNVQEGMTVNVGNIETVITGVGIDDYGYAFAVAKTDLEDGLYNATVNYKRTQVLGLLFGN